MSMNGMIVSLDAPAVTGGSVGCTFFFWGFLNSEDGEVDGSRVFGRSHIEGNCNRNQQGNRGQSMMTEGRTSEKI